MNDESRPPASPESVPPESAAPAPGGPGGRGLKIAIAIGVVLLAGGLWLVTLIPGWLARDPTATSTETTPGSTSTRRIQATLFYVSEDGSELVPVTREVAYGATPAEQAKFILDAQVQAPDGLGSAIPAGTSVRAVFLSSKGEAYVDLSPEASLAHKGGTLDEALAVFAIVNAVTTNLPTVTAVQILVDGKEVDSLAGHIDLREPIGRSDIWVRKGQ
jgi:spore germination protein GerM